MVVKATITIQITRFPVKGPHLKVEKAVLKIEGVEQNLMNGFIPPYIWEKVKPVWEGNKVTYERRSLIKTDIDIDYLLSVAKRRAEETIRENLKKLKQEENHIKTIEITIAEE